MKNIWNVTGKQRKALAAVLVLTASVYGGISGEAANLVATIPSNYAQSQMGAINVSVSDR